MLKGNQSVLEVTPIKIEPDSTKKSVHSITVVQEYKKQKEIMNESGFSHKDDTTLEIAKVNSDSVINRNVVIVERNVPMESRDSGSHGGHSERAKSALKSAYFEDQGEHIHDDLN